MNRCFRRLFLVTVPILMTTACGTPKPVIDLADQSAAITQLLATEAQTLANERRRLAQARASRIARIKQLANENSAFIAEELAVYKAAGHQKILKRLKMLATLVEATHQFDQNQLDVGQVTQQILSSNQKIKIDAASAKKAGDALAKLAKDESVVARVEFIGSFAADVYNNLKEETEAAEESSEEGDKAADAAADALEKTTETTRGDLTQPLPSTSP